MPSRPLCTIPDCDEHYACRLRAKGLRVSPKLETTRTQNWRPTKTEPSSFNRQIMYDKRPDGSMMPIMNPNGEVVRRKEFGERRHEIESTIRRIRNTDADITSGA